MCAQKGIFKISGKIDENFIGGLYYVALDHESKTRVKNAVVHWEKAEEFLPVGGKFKSLVFCEVLIREFGIEVIKVCNNKDCYRFGVTDEMKEFAQKYFVGLNPETHGGFFEAFMKSNSIEIYMK